MGRATLPPTASTPGAEASWWRSWSKKATCWASVPYFALGKETLKARTCSGLNPGSTAIQRRKLFSMTPEPISSTIARATSVTTSAERRPPPWCEVLTPSLSMPCTPGRVACSAGAKPKSRPSRRVIPPVKASTAPSMPMASILGRLIGLEATSALIARYAMPSPAAPPTAESNTLSVSSCRASRQRPAPIAVRIAISRCRAVARASSRLARLAQAISSTKPTAPMSTSSAGRILPTTCSLACLV